MLIQRCGAEKHHLESPDEFGDSLLHIISKNNAPNEKAVKILIEANADIERGFAPSHRLDSNPEALTPKS